MRQGLFQTSWPTDAGARLGCCFAGHTHLGQMARSFSHNTKLSYVKPQLVIRAIYPGHRVASFTTVMLNDPAQNEVAKIGFHGLCFHPSYLLALQSLTY